MNCSGDIQETLNTVVCGDALSILKTWPDQVVNCVVTSPPYWGLRDYGVEGQLGLEKTPEEYIAKMVELFREVRRVLRVRLDGRFYHLKWEDNDRRGGQKCTVKAVKKR